VKFFVLFNCTDTTQKLFIEICGQLANAEDDRDRIGLTESGMRQLWSKLSEGTEKRSAIFMTI